MVVLTAETCWAMNEYWINNKISGIKLVFLFTQQVLNILNMVYTLLFFLLQNAVCFIILKYLVPALFTFYIQSVLKLKKIIPAPKGYCVHSRFHGIDIWKKLRTESGTVQVMVKNSWFQTFVLFWILYAFFWVIPRCLNFICRRFGTLCLPMRME